FLGPTLVGLALVVGLAGASVAIGGEPAPPEKIVIPPESFQTPGHETSATGQEPAEADRRFNFETFRARVDGLWFKRKAFLKKGLSDAAGEQIEAIEDLGNEIGVTRLDTVAASLVREGRNYLDEGNFDKATRSFKDAGRF